MAKAVVVDNNPQELLHTAKVLKELGAFEKVIQFEDSLEAVKYIEQYGCDVLFTEVEMKGINGFEFIWRFRRLSPAIYIVFVTKERSYALQAFEYSAADFIVKPVDTKSIGRVMKKLNIYMHE